MAPEFKRLASGFELGPRLVEGRSAGGSDSARCPVPRITALPHKRHKRFMIMLADLSMRDCQPQRTRRKREWARRQQRQLQFGISAVVSASAQLRGYLRYTCNLYSAVTNAASSSRGRAQAPHPPRTHEMKATSRLEGGGTASSTISAQGARRVVWCGEILSFLRYRQGCALKAASALPNGETRNMSNAAVDNRKEEL